MRWASLKSLCCLVLLYLSFFIFTPSLEASITLKITVVNPSSIKQTVPVKVYLPVEVKPEDIIFKEDLEVAYDTQLGSHYVFGEYQLEPKAVLEKEIEINDVWMISDIDLESLRQEAKKIKAGAEKTDVAQSINLICDAIDKRINEIDQMQKVAPTSPPQHISDYRYCANLLEVVKSDLVKARTLLSQVPARPGLTATVWKIIIFVIIFLGVLGLASYIIWQRQEKLNREVGPIEPKDEFSPLGKNLKEEQRKPEEEPSGPGDIEKIIREGK